MQLQKIRNYKNYKRIIANQKKRKTVTLPSQPKYVLQIKKNNKRLQKQQKRKTKIRTNNTKQKTLKKQRLTAKSARNQLVCMSLYLHGTEIPKTDNIKYLGVTKDPKLNWNKHTYNDC